MYFELLISFMLTGIIYTWKELVVVILLYVKYRRTLDLQEIMTLEIIIT